MASDQIVWRRRLWLGVALGCALAWPAFAAPPRPNIAWRGSTGQAILTTGRLELIVETKPGLNARALRDVESGTVYADRDYSWPGGAFPVVGDAPALVQHGDGDATLRFKGRLGALEVEQCFEAPASQPGVILERITIRNLGTAALATADFKCGFAKLIRAGETWMPDADGAHFCPVPYRRETNGQMQEFPLREVAEHGTSFAVWAQPLQPTPIWGAEGWVWSRLTNTLLIAKYNADSMEWSLMEPEARGTETIIRFGGAGQWKYGHPEASGRLEPGGAYALGETRYQAVAGDWQQAYYAYRGYMDAHGCTTPPKYDPPVHWNELYDNEYYGRVCAISDEEYRARGVAGLFGPAFAERNRKLLGEFYSLELMKGEAAKAKELGCETLYLDPGWDTGSNQQVWDTERLGPMEAFVRMMKDDYGLRGVGLWCSLAGVPPTLGDPGACPPEARVIKADGKPDELLVCVASPAFLDTKEKRLLEVCRNGAVFLMFDSNQYTGPCYAPNHGHAVPSTREDHAKALLELARRVRSRYPHVLIEMHDFITGPSGIHYTPTYYGYARPNSFTELWGHEFMWNPMDDVLSRRAVSLYYFNLAYSIPFYLHINLKTDNANALVFWWFASTIRHLGVGGKADGPVWAAQQQAMRTYLPLKRFYTQGIFYGLDEMVHVHTLPDLRAAVINAFNLEAEPVTRTVRFTPAEIGLPAGDVEVEGATARREDGRVAVELTIPARGHLLLKVRAAGAPNQ